MNSKLIVPLVLALSFGTACVNAVEVKTHEHLTATFKTHDGKEIRCVVPREDGRVLNGVRKGEKISFIAEVPGHTATDTRPQGEWRPIKDGMPVATTAGG